MKKRGINLQGLIAVLTLVFPPFIVANVSVNGKVVDSAGIEASHAYVEALPRMVRDEGGVVGDRPNPWIETDEHGRFTISLPEGRYKIVAKNESEGYPDPVFSLNSDPTAKFPEVSVKEQNISNVNVVLGKRGGVLEGELRGQSETPIQNGKVTIRDARNPDAYVDVFTNARGEFRFTVPNKPLLIFATADGYQPSRFEAGAEVTLSAGETRTILLQLEPK